MKLVVGLGNPGPDYERTRHNIGFQVVERIAARHRIVLRREKHLCANVGAGRVAGVDTTLFEPQTYMNRSGGAVLAALDAYPIDPATDLLVVYDDLDLPFGRLRLRPGGGAGGHNGLGDIQERTGRSDFARLRFGIGRPPTGEDPIAFVLAPFAEAERAQLDAHLDAAADAVERMLTLGVARAMNQVNGPPVVEPPE